MPLPQLFKLPYDRVSPKDKESFAYTTLVKRWPVVLTNVISAVSNANHEISMSSSADRDAKVAEGKKIISQISEMKYEMGHNALLSPIEDDGEINVDCYNEELASYPEEDRKWANMNWLFAECYVYRRLRSYFALTQYWKSYDPFFDQKAETYRSSSGAILHLAKAINSAVAEKHELDKDFEKPGSALEIAFMEMIQADLWGNATDLSLLIDLKYEDLQKLQAVGSEAQAEQAKFILRNDLSKTWEHIKGLKNGRIDFVMDNAGFELFTDFILADFLISCTPFVSTVVFHPKAIPWFVSDVVPYDFAWTIDSLLDATFFSQHASQPLTDEDTASLTSLGKRWKVHLEAGRFKLSVPLDTPFGKAPAVGGFWSTQYAYQDMPAMAPDVLAELQKSDLVIFKGDLNYRKLVGDAWWPTTTPFDEAIGPLAGQITLLSLRTNKADTIAGLDEGVAERVDKEAPDWRVSGKYAVVIFSKRR
ncbi:hypothetical protein I305_05301 [Cryptococcus gattii E566]|uniref:Sugar phosphate phosphatase n=2 Tax=Cryptococcus gattii TaxID=37769 RepID=E6R7L2_CRYGW|nr:uncharacterized protein CGB_F0310W [Cryptococcus gattii WM276]ADV22777.1 Conserved hypothetical protein [Cryptococcus gattii WM276]KIR82769.1 hypothetical protein I306_00034 [Cryptococcus gattii EJB2]KIY32342.1 hypothetical protein I305_05301 [Cryptococcus gattii E566]KJE04654.1 hypothetical protein I311_01453 [Cryptococcus gattii NT-10]